MLGAALAVGGLIVQTARAAGVGDFGFVRLQIIIASAMFLLFGAAILVYVFSFRVGRARCTELTRRFPTAVVVPVLWTVWTQNDLKQAAPYLVVPRDVRLTLTLVLDDSGLSFWTGTGDHPLCFGQVSDAALKESVAVQKRRYGVRRPGLMVLVEKHPVEFSVLSSRLFGAGRARPQELDEAVRRATQFGGDAHST